MKPVMVSVRSIQRDCNGEDTVMELVSQGCYYEKNKAMYIQYNESEVTGLEGTKTTLKIGSESMTIIRTGAVKMRHQYVLGRTDDAYYETPMGEMELTIKTHELTNSIVDGEGEVCLGYDIAIGGEWELYNQLQVRVWEDMSKWK